MITMMMTWQCWAQVWASLSLPPPPPHRHPSPGKTLKTWSGSSVMTTMITMMVMMMMTDHFPPFLSSFSSCFCFSSSFCRETSKYNIFVVQIFTYVRFRRKSHKFWSPAEYSKVYIWETLIFSWPSTHLTWNIKFKIWNLIWRNTEFFLAILPLISYLWEKRRGINIEISLSSYYWSSFFFIFLLIIIIIFIHLLTQFVFIVILFNYHHFSRIAHEAKIENIS